MSLNTIPDDCLVSILSRVSLTSLVVTGKLVCQRWHSLIEQRICREKRTLIIVPVGYYRFIPVTCYEGQQIPPLLSLPKSVRLESVRQKCRNHSQAQRQLWRQGPTQHCTTIAQPNVLPIVTLSLHSKFEQNFQLNLNTDKPANKIVQTFPYIRRVRIMWPCVNEMDQLIAAFMDTDWFNRLERLQIIVYWRNGRMPIDLGCQFNESESKKVISLNYKLKQQWENDWNRLLLRLTSAEPLVRSLVHLTLHDSTERCWFTRSSVRFPEDFFQHSESRLVEFYTSLTIMNINEALRKLLIRLHKFGFTNLLIALGSHFRIYRDVQRKKDFLFYKNRDLSNSLKHFVYAPPLEGFRDKPVDFISRLTGLTYLHIRTQLPLLSALKLYQLDQLPNLIQLRIANEYERTPPFSEFRDYLRRYRDPNLQLFEWEEENFSVPAPKTKIVQFSSKLIILRLFNPEHTQPAFGNWAAKVFPNLNRLIIDQSLTNCKHCPKVSQTCEANEDNFWKSIYAQMKTVNEIHYLGTVRQTLVNK